MRLLDRGIEIKTPEQIRLMRRAGLIVADTLAALREAVRPGVTPAELDALAEDRIRSAGATPSFLGYQGFPAAICVSVNDVVVHGIPDGRPLEEGDVVSLDCGAVVSGWHGDAAITVPVGDAAADVRRLLAVTDAALWAGIAAVHPGGRLGAVSQAVEAAVRGAGAFGIVEDYVGHGIGSALHQPPDVPNVGRSRRGPRLVPGLAVAIEPMVTLGSPRTVLREDEWTVVTADGTRSAHSEHTVAVTERGVWVLTAPDGGEAHLAALGAPFGGPLGS